MYSSVDSRLRGFFSNVLFQWVNRLDPKKKNAKRMKAKTTPVFLKAEKKIQAHRRQKIIGTTPAAKEGDVREPRSIPPARLNVG